MKIHTFNQGDTVKNISKEYGITEECLLASNIKGAENPVVGEELLILIPTRTYTLKHGDTPERLALRFGIRKSDLLAQNPWIATEGMVPGRMVNLKYDDRMYGTAPTNGYLYRGCDEKRLEQALPYLTYVTLAAAEADDKDITFVFDDSELVKRLSKENKIPLLRVYDKSRKRELNSKEKRERFVKKIIEATLSRGYHGVVISAAIACGKFDDFGEFLIELRKAMIGCELILILEVDESVPADICELADGNILFYPKYMTSPCTSFDDGEKRFYSDFATNAESAKAFIDISALANLGEKFISIEEATQRARMQNTIISTNAKTLISEFRDKNHGSCSFSSLKNTKQIYDLIEEYGFMGASFDIGRTPITHLLMYNVYFRTAQNTNVRAPEGCAKGS